MSDPEKVLCQGCECWVPYLESFAASIVGNYMCKWCAMEGELEDSFSHLAPDFAKLDLDLARAHLLRTLQVKRCKDVMRNACFIDDPESFVPPSERVMELTRRWYTEAFPICEKGGK